MRWHEALARATQEPAADRDRARHPRGGAAPPPRGAAPRVDEHVATIPADLAAITQAVAAGDGDAARRLMRAHIEAWNTRGLERMSPFTKLHHLCVVVQRHRARAGVLRVGGDRAVAGLPAAARVHRAGRARPGRASATSKYRYAWIGDIQIQLCQPGPGPTPQRRFLDERGEGVFHSASRSRTRTPPRPTVGAACSR